MTLKDNRFDVSRTGAMMLSRLGVRAEPEHMYALVSGAGTGVIPNIMTGVGYAPHNIFRGRSPSSVGLWPSSPATINVGIVLPWGDTIAVMGHFITSIPNPVVWDKSAATWVSLGSNFAGSPTSGFTFDTNKIAASFATNNSPRVYAVAYYNGSTWATFGTSTGTSWATRIRGIYNNNIIYDLNGVVRIYDTTLGASAAIPLPTNRFLSGTGISFDGKFWINVQDRSVFPGVAASIYYWNGTSWTDTGWQGDIGLSLNQERPGFGSMGVRAGRLVWIADSTLYESDGATIVNTVALPGKQYYETYYCTQMLVNRSPDTISFPLQFTVSSTLVYWIFEYDGTSITSPMKRPYLGPVAYYPPPGSIVPLTSQLF